MLDKAKEGQLGEVQRLVQNGAVDVTTGERHGETALLLAASSGNLEVVRRLMLEDGLGLKERNDNGYTALLCASHNNSNLSLNMVVVVCRDLQSKGGTQCACPTPVPAQ